MSAKRLAEQDLKRSGITWLQAKDAGMFTIPDATKLHSKFHSVPAMVIPYADPATGTVMQDGEGPFYRLRYLEEPPSPPGFKKRKAPRYVQPPHSDVHAYFPVTQHIDWRKTLADRTIPILIVEGEKKALKGCLDGFPTIGLGGVFNYTTLPEQLLPELEAVVWKKRVVYIAFDSDINDNPDIQVAEARLITLLAHDHGAIVKPIRLPSTAEGEKVGLDDFLVAEGPKALKLLLKKAKDLGKTEIAVASLNQRICWIESEACIYEYETKAFIAKDSLINGSKYSPLKLFVPNAKGDGMKEVSATRTWLTHPHAARFDDIVMAPDRDETTIVNGHGKALNMWTGLEGEEGDITPFLELSRFLFKDLPPDSQDLPLKLMAYKAQHPGEKIPLAIVMVGLQGSGKSLWADILREAFEPYSKEIGSRVLASEYNGFIESSLLAVIGEAEPEDLQRHGGVLRSLITDVNQHMNEKYRKARQIKSYTFYIINSNKHGVAAYSQDDRRMFVISCPEKREASFYEPLIPSGAWRKNGGAAKVLQYLLDYDLGDWKPPSQAPMTPEKYMAYVESLTPAERLAEETHTADENVVSLWVRQSMAWAEEAETSNDPGAARLAREINDSLPHIQIRPFYSPEELALMFPAIASTLHGNRKLSHTVAGELSRGLRNAGVRYLRCSDDPRGFRWQGMIRQYLIMAEPDRWAEPMSQTEFEQWMHQFPKFSEMQRKRKR